MQAFVLLLLAALWLAWTVFGGKAERPPESSQVVPCEKIDTSRYAAVLFEHHSTALNPPQIPALKILADDAKSRLKTGAATVELRAYAGSVGDVSAHALDISRKRALALRDALVSDGVPGDRISLRPMGGAIDCGDPDRVDIFMRKS
jgi:outer membrane protein OmpA-like peptidoglycan-associated protein